MRADLVLVASSLASNTPEHRPRSSTCPSRGGKFKPLLRELEYTDEERQGVVRWWPLGRDRRVVLDPRVAFGAPVTRDEGVPTESLYHGWLAERDVARVAEWYKASPAAVCDAIEFEGQHRMASV